MQALPFDTWHNGCVQNIPGGAFPAVPRCRTCGRPAWRPRRGGGIPYPPENCPSLLGPDWDFAAPAAMATTTDGRDILIAPQKQGLVWALNPDNGQVIWKQDVAREIAGGRGETLFGGAVDNEKAYFGLISSAHLALDLKTGEEVWYVADRASAGTREPARRGGGRDADSGRAALRCARRHDPRSLIAHGSIDLGVRQRAGIQDRQRRTARGGSAASGGPVVANGMVFIGSGYPGFQGGQPGNVLLAFAPAVRLDVHADELKRRSEPRMR